MFLYFLYNFLEYEIQGVKCMEFILIHIHLGQNCVKCVTDVVTLNKSTQSPNVIFTESLLHYIFTIYVIFLIFS